MSRRLVEKWKSTFWIYFVYEHIMDLHQNPTFQRILLVEDDQERARILISYLPKHIRVVHAPSAGRALGVVKMDHRSRQGDSPYSGIMLDHDLQEQIVCADEKKLSGMNVVDAIIDYVPRSVPILIHSMNPSEAPIMVNKLKSAGFSVTRLPMRELTKENLSEWLEDECDVYNDPI